MGHDHALNDNTLGVLQIYMCVSLHRSIDSHVGSLLFYLFSFLGRGLHLVSYSSYHIHTHSFSYLSVVIGSFLYTQTESLSLSMGILLSCFSPLSFWGERISAATQIVWFCSNWPFVVCLAFRAPSGRWSLASSSHTLPAQSAWALLSLITSRLLLKPFLSQTMFFSFFGRIYSIFILLS